MRSLILRVFALIVIFSLSCLTLQAQYSWKKPKGTHGLVFGFDLGMRLIDAQDNDYVDTATYLSDVYSEAAKLSFRFGYNYSRYINNAMYLKTGLRFINPTFNSYFAISLDQNFRESVLDLDESNFPYKTSYVQQYYFLEWPLHIRRMFMSKHCRSFVELGITTQYYLGTRITETKKDVETVYQLREAIAPFYLTGIASLGAEFDLNDKIPAFIQMVLRYQLNEVNKGLAQERLISLGIEAGTRYYF